MHVYSHVVKKRLFRSKFPSNIQNIFVNLDYKSISDIIPRSDLSLKHIPIYLQKAELKTKPSEFYKLHLKIICTHAAILPTTYFI